MNKPYDMSKASHVYRRLLGYVKDYWKGFALAIGSLVVVAATETSFAAIMKPLLDGSFVEKDPDIIRLMPIVIVGVFILRGIATFISNYCMRWVARNVIRDLRSQLFEHILRLPINYFDTTSSSHVSVKIVNHVEQVSQAATTVITIVVRDTLTVIGLLGWMFYLNWRLSMVFIVIIPVMALLIRFISLRFRAISRNIHHSIGDVLHVAKEAIDGQRVIKIFGGQERERQQFSKVNEYNRQQNMKMAVANALNEPVTQLVASFALAGIIYFATDKAMLDEITVGTFMSLIAAMMLLMPSLKRLTNINAQLQNGITACQSVFELIDQPAELDAGSTKMEKASGKIEYRDVMFRYTGYDEPFMRDISFIAHPGQTVAFVGRSGSGKSTLVSLLPRFYEVSGGTIFIDGQDIRDVPLEDLRRQIALVTQHITLFNDTIANNIAYGTLGQVSREDVIRAAKAANVMEFIEQLPQGLETLVGENGILLSGGQRQRLAIARALLKNAPILILDEATSALDTESERLVQNALEKLMSQRTTLVIAHRLSTIEKADRIIVLDHGRIVETGSHMELLAMNGYYTRLHQMQFHDADIDRKSPLHDQA